MSVFIGGDTQSLEYDFGLKVAGSVAECPMKLYKGAIDVNNPPSPFTYPQQVSDFGGKVVGSVVECPNICKKPNVLTSIANPSNFVEWIAQASYDNIKTLNNVMSNTPNTVNGEIAQQLFSFDLIQIFERQYGTIPGTTDTASKVAWLKNNISSMVCDYYGYGSGPSGNKVYLTHWYNSGSTWSTTDTVNNASTTPTKLNLNFSMINPGYGNYIPNNIDSNGFIHFLVYTDASNGTTASVVNTDYISLTINYKDQSNVTWWQEVTDQRTLDKLKVQNEIPITSVDYANRTAVWNGKNLVLQTDSVPSVRDDYAGKISGSTVENPNKLYFSTTNSLQSPNTPIKNDARSGLWDIDLGTFDFTQIGLQGGEKFIITTKISNIIPQHFFSFNIIRMLEDKYGSLPCSNDLASKVAYIKSNISNIEIDWIGYGSCPTGYLAQIRIWNGVSWICNQNGSTTAQSVPTLKQLILNTPDQFNTQIQNDGFIHILAYTDAARTTDSTLLVLTGHGLTTGDVIENTTRSKASGVTKGADNVLVTAIITGQVAGDNIKKFIRGMSKIAESGTTTTSIKITNHGLLTGDYINNTRDNWILHKVTVIDANTFTLDSAITGLSSGDSIVPYRYSGTQTAESTVIPSNIYTDYISLDIQLKSPAGYDLLVPTNPRRDSVTGGNYDNCILAEKVYNSITSDFTGKVAGSVVECPNTFYRTYQSSLFNPGQKNSDYNAGFQEFDQASYDLIRSQNNSCRDGGTSVSGKIPQQLFQFDLVKIFEKQYGTIPATDKISWLKANLSDIKCDWTGYGSKPGGNKAYLDVYMPDKEKYVGSPYYVTNTSSSPTTLKRAVGSENLCVDSNGFINFIVYTDASDGVTASTIYTDYVKLTLTFSNGNNAIEYFTNNSVEMATQTNNKATAYLIETDLTPVATALYGGSNVALKNALKGLQADIWASGYSANDNDVVNGVKMIPYANDGGGYKPADMKNSVSNNITDVIYIANTFTHVFMQTNNKIYFLITSTNNSTTDVPSVVNLDYAKIKIDLARVPDIINNPPTIELTPTWSILVRGFSPSWCDKNSSYSYPEILLLRNNINNKLLELYYRKQTNTIVANFMAGSTTVDVTLPAFNKYTVQNILICLKSDKKLYLYVLLNNGVLLTNVSAKTISNDFVDSTTLKILMDSMNSNMADAFLDSIVYMPNQVWDDTQAEAILRGTKEGFEFPELFDINQVTLHPNATRSNGVITLNANGSWNNSTLNVPILPNNQYTIKGNISSGKITIGELYNNILIKANDFYSSNGLVGGTLTTSNKTNKLIITVTNGSLGVGTFTFSNISLKLKM